MNLYGKDRAHELKSEIRACENEESIKQVIINFLKTGQTASDRNWYNFFRSPTRNSGIEGNSLRGILFNHFFQNLRNTDNWLRTVSIKNILENNEILGNINISSGVQIR